MTTFRDDIVQMIILALFATIIGFGIVLLLVQFAPASSVCLSKKEARELWPQRHLYWYSKDHCWSNRRGPPRNIKIDPVVNSSAQATTTEWTDVPQASNKIKKQNQLKREAPDKVVSAPLDSREPLRIEKDFCCWPDLQQLEREVVEMHWKRLKGWLEYKP